MRYQWAGAGLAAIGLMMAAPLAAQTTDTGTTAPPRDPQPPPKVSPAQVIGVIKGLIKPKPSPAVFPTPTPSSQPTLAPTAASALYPAPTPQPVPTVKPVGAVRSSFTPVAQPSTVAPLPSAAVSATPTPLATAAEPLPETAALVPETAPAELSGPPPSGPFFPWWVWLVVGGSAGGLAELARRWFWPKPTIGCEIAVGPGALTQTASPAFTAPEINIAIRIEPGEASAPAGYPILAQGDTT